MHAQYGWTPLFETASSGCVAIAQMLMEKGANIEATDQVQLAANVYLLTIHVLLQCEVVSIH